MFCAHTCGALLARDADVRLSSGGFLACIVQFLGRSTAGAAGLLRLRLSPRDGKERKSGHVGFCASDPSPHTWGSVGVRREKKKKKCRATLLSLL